MSVCTISFRFDELTYKRIKALSDFSLFLVNLNFIEVCFIKKYNKYDMVPIFNKWLNKRQAIFL